MGQGGGRGGRVLCAALAEGMAKLTTTIGDVLSMSARSGYTRVDWDTFPADTTSFTDLSYRMNQRSFPEFRFHVSCDGFLMRSFTHHLAPLIFLTTQTRSGGRSPPYLPRNGPSVVCHSVFYVAGTLGDFMERRVAKSLASLNLHTTDCGPRLRFALHRLLLHCQCECVTANFEELGSTS